MSFPQPIIHWKLNGDGINYGSAGSTYNLSLVNTSFSDNRIVGSKSLYFNGTNAYAYCNANPFAASTSLITVTAWVRCTADGGGGLAIGFGNNTTDTDRDNMQLGVLNRGELNLGQVGHTYYRANINGSVASVGTSGVWHFFAVSYTGIWANSTASAKIYLNKTQGTTVVANYDGSVDPWPLNNNIVIGRTWIPWSSSFTYGTAGNMDDIRVFNSVLTKAQIDSIYNHSAPKINIQPFL